MTLKQNIYRVGDLRIYVPEGHEFGTFVNTNLAEFLRRD